MEDGKEDDEDIEFVKKAAVEIVSFINEARRTVIEQHSQSFRWLTASLLAINGASALAVLTKAGEANFDAQTAGALFIGGIVLALFVGVASQRTNQAILPNLQEQLGYWLVVAHDGERVETREQELNDEMSSKMRLGVFTQVFGWLSGILFLGGAICIGLSLENQATKLESNAAPKLSSAGAVEEESKERR